MSKWIGHAQKTLGTLISNNFLMGKDPIVAMELSYIFAEHLLLC